MGSRVTAQDERGRGLFWVGLGKENEINVANRWLAFGTFVGNIVDAGGLSKKNLTDISWLVCLIE